MMIVILLAATLLKPCAFEDSTGCTWYAFAQGNGQGVTTVRVW